MQALVDDVVWGRNKEVLSQPLEIAVIIVADARSASIMIAVRSCNSCFGRSLNTAELIIFMLTSRNLAYVSIMIYHCTTFPVQIQVKSIQQIKFSAL